MRAIARDCKTPMAVSKMRRLKHDVGRAAKAKEQHVRAHSTSAPVPFVPAKKAAVRRKIN